MQAQRPLAVVTPTLDGDVLTVLAGADAAFTAPQVAMLAAERADPSVEGVRKALGRLVAQGIVDVELVGRTHQYRLNREHLAAPAIVMLARQFSTLVQRLGEGLASWSSPPVYGALFGSAARGQMRADSDLDLFLVRADDADLDAWEADADALTAAAARWTGNDVRVLTMTKQEVTGADGDPVVDAVLREGLTLIGDHLWRPRVLSAQRASR